MVPLTEGQRRPVLSIDLGASYTKLAWRNAWHGTEEYNSRSKIIQLDGEECVPSLVVDLGGGGKWIFGEEAAKSVPGKGWCPHRNWKAGIFSPDNNSQSIAVAQDVAKRYIHWILLKVAKEKGSAEVKRALVRFSVPAFGGEESRRGEARLRQAAVAAGLAEQVVRFTSEPKSNIIGLASAGRNCVRLFSDGAYPHLGKIYDSHTLIAAARQAMIYGVLSRQKIGIIDLGSFTTDFSGLRSSKRRRHRDFRGIFVSAWSFQVG